MAAPPPSGYSEDAAPPPDQAPSQPYDPGQQQAPPPDQPATFQTFYDSLGQQGTWMQTSDYGYVWQPAVNDPDWAPYTVGHWVYADVGWTWVSDEPWGWATYHYGRWVNLDGAGWCWVPGYTWAPAWVSWRYGGGYCGWAPLPPDSFIGIDYFGAGIDINIGFHIGGDCDSYYGIGPGCYHFVPVNCIGYNNYHGHYVNRGDNYTIINNTSNVTNLNVTRNPGGGHRGGTFGHVTTGGPSYNQVNAASTHPVPHVNLVNASQPGGGHVSGHSLALYAPHLTPGNASSGQPARVGGSLGQATVNRGLDITRPLAVNRNVSPAPPTQSQVQVAHQAQAHAPTQAKVASSVSPDPAPLPAPLTALKPITVPSHLPAQNTTPYSPHPGTASGSLTTHPSMGPVSVPTHIQQGQSFNAPAANTPTPGLQPQHVWGSTPTTTPNTSFPPQVNPHTTGTPVTVPSHVVTPNYKTPSSTYVPPQPSQPSHYNQQSQQPSYQHNYSQGGNYSGNSGNNGGSHNQGSNGGGYNGNGHGGNGGGGNPWGTQNGNNQQQHH